MKQNFCMKHHLFVLFIFSFFSCQTNTPSNNTTADTTPAKKPINQIKVKVTQVIDDVFNKQVISNGTVISKNTAQLHFRQAGYIRQVNDRNGQHVPKGAVIAVLENDLLNNAVQQARIQVDKARQKYEQLRIEYQTGQPDKLKMQAGLSEAKARLQEAQIKYRQSFLKAPFSGTIANLKVKQGNYVRPSDTICSLLDNSKLFVDFQILPSDFALIHKNTPIEIQDFYHGDMRYKGVITDINPQVNRQGLISVRGKITNRHAPFINGIRVKVIINQTGKKMPVIPKTALVLRNNKEVVFTYEKGLAIWHYVKIFGENERYYAISEGLKAGDTIIISNNINLAHEAVVKIEP